MDNSSKQHNELVLIGTILECNKRLFESTRLPRCKKYFKKFNNLYSLSTGLNNLNESVELLPNAVEFPKTGNLYSYYNKVSKFLNTFEVPLQESLDSLSNVQQAIRDFKIDLKTIINKLEKQDSFDNYTDNILKIKILSKQSLTVCGFDIINNLALMSELSVKFGLSNNNLLALVYNKYDKELLFIGYNTSNVVKYNIKTDELEKKEFENKSFKFNPINYLQELKQLTGINNLFEIYVSINALSLKYTDNVYQDKANTELLKQFYKETSIVK